VPDSPAPSARKSLAFTVSLSTLASLYDFLCRTAIGVRWISFRSVIPLINLIGVTRPAPCIFVGYWIYDCSFSICHTHSL
jgi:hypothetical protein